MDSYTFVACGAVVALALAGPINGQTQERKPGETARSNMSSTEAELVRLRAEVIQSLQATRERLDNLLAIYEKNANSLTEEFDKRRLLYERGYISRVELEETERALAATMTDAEQVRRWIMQDEFAITEALSRDALLTQPILARGEYGETAAFVRYNGAADWSLGEASKIEKFFSETFGRALPVSAFGQTPVHDRMKFDHRDAMDVAVHPDSAEGRALMAHLRRERIPFLAFRGKLTGASTGAHIHIGRPSIRDAVR